MIKIVVPRFCNVVGEAPANDELMAPLEPTSEASVTEPAGETPVLPAQPPVVITEWCKEESDLHDLRHPAPSGGLKWLALAPAEPTAALKAADDIRSEP